MDDSDKQVDILKPQVNLLISATKLEGTSENTLGKQIFLSDLKRSLASVVYKRNEESVQKHIDVNRPQFIDKNQRPSNSLKWSQKYLAVVFIYKLVRTCLKPVNCF